MGVIDIYWRLSLDGALEWAIWRDKKIKVKPIEADALKRGVYNNVIADEGYMALQTRFVEDYKINDEIEFRGKRYIITDIKRDASESGQATMYMGGRLQDITLQLFEIGENTRHYKVANPQIALADGKIEISCDTIGAVIYYTTDGTRPSALSNKYTEPFDSDASEVWAIAVKQGYALSEVAKWSSTKMF